MSVTLSTAKSHLRVTSTSEDAIIQAYLNAATAWIERFIGKKLTAGAVTEYFTEFGDFLQLSYGPFDTITGVTVTYTDEAGDSDTVTGRLRDGRIYPPDGGWPTTEEYSTITVAYTAGFATTPTELEQAQLLLTNYFYENRGLGMPLEKSAEGQALDSLCRPFRKPTLK